MTFDEAIRNARAAIRKERATPPKERYQAMVRSGLITQDGRVVFGPRSGVTISYQKSDGKIVRSRPAPKTK